MKDILMPFVIINCRGEIRPKKNAEEREKNHTFGRGHSALLFGNRAVGSLILGDRSRRNVRKKQGALFVEGSICSLVLSLGYIICDVL